MAVFPPARLATERLGFTVLPNQDQAELCRVDALHLVRVNDLSPNKNYQINIVNMFVIFLRQQKPVCVHTYASYQAVIFKKTKERVLM